MMSNAKRTARIAGLLYLLVVLTGPFVLIYVPGKLFVPGSASDTVSNILAHEYTIGEGRNKVAQVSKKWFRIRDSYGVEIEPGQDDIVILAVTVCIDQMAHD